MRTVYVIIRTTLMMAKMTEASSAGEFADSAILSNYKLYQQQLGKFLAPAVGQNPQWKLCFRASSAGGVDSLFHKRCDRKPNTVTIVKAGEYVFVGYTEISWDWLRSYPYGNTPNAFIYSLRDREGLAPFKSMVKDPLHAIASFSGHGPVFGIGDIFIHERLFTVGTAFGTSYSLPSGVQDPHTILGGSSYFVPDLWEVFYLA